MDPTLDNAMILGGIGNLRLAPHVREGRGVGAVGGARPAAGPAGSAASTNGSRGPGFVTGEKVTISAAAREALAEAPVTSRVMPDAESAVTSGAAPVPPESAAAASRPTPGILPAGVAAAYASAAGAEPAPSTPVERPAGNAWFA